MHLYLTEPVTGSGTVSETGDPVQPFGAAFCRDRRSATRSVWVTECRKSEQNSIPKRGQSAMLAVGTELPAGNAFIAFAGLGAKRCVAFTCIEI
ncbi:MAG: hypothetical protein Tsb0019_22520 [Roseibium sp.]